MLLLVRPSTPAPSLTPAPDLAHSAAQGEHVASKSRMVAAHLYVVMKLPLLKQSGSSHRKSIDGCERPRSALVDGDGLPGNGVNPHLQGI